MKKIALIGMPNSGKSTFFNSISGASARIANWSGVTVDIESVRTLIFGEMVELIDLPGIYSLQSGSDDEVVVHKFLKNNQIDEIFFILNSTQIDRQILLASELLSMGYTLRILCNMNDEAKKSGIQIQSLFWATHFFYYTFFSFPNYLRSSRTNSRFSWRCI